MNFDEEETFLASAFLTVLIVLILTYICPSGA